MMLILVLITNLYCFLREKVVVIDDQQSFD